MISMSTFRKFNVDKILLFNGQAVFEFPQLSQRCSSSGLFSLIQDPVKDHKSHLVMLSPLSSLERLSMLVAFHDVDGFKSPRMGKMWGDISSLRAGGAVLLVFVFFAPGREPGSQ